MQVERPLRATSSSLSPYPVPLSMSLKGSLSVLLELRLIGGSTVLEFLARPPPIGFRQRNAQRLLHRVCGLEQLGEGEGTEGRCVAV